MSGQLPDNWTWIKFDDAVSFITDFQANGSFASLKENVRYYESKNYAILVRLKDLRNNLEKTEDLIYTDKEGYEFLNKSSLKGGEILVANVGAGVGTTLTMPEVDHAATLAPNMFLVFLKDFLAKKYFLYYCSSNAYGDEIARVAGGSGQPKMNKKEYRSIAFPIAPLTEQHRIVARIEELFSRLDAGMEELKKAKLQLQRYRQSVLKAAVEGRLTEGWRKAHPEVEPAVPIKSSLDLDEEKLIKIPDSWIWTSFSSLLIEPLRNGHSAKASADGKGIRTLTLTAVTKRQFSEKNSKITVADPKKVKDLWLKKDDILIERSNTIDYVGLSAIYLGEDGFAIFPDLLIRARVSPSNVSPTFAEKVLRTSFSRDYFKRNAQGISGSMPKIDQGTIERLPFPLPPLREQDCIIGEVERRISISDDLEAAIVYDLRRSQRLRQSILKHAFDGKLVPQDPNDEPASLLLERITTERIKESPRRGRKSNNANQMRLVQ